MIFSIILFYFILLVLKNIRTCLHLTVKSSSQPMWAPASVTALCLHVWLWMWQLFSFLFFHVDRCTFALHLISIQSQTYRLIFTEAKEGKVDTSLPPGCPSTVICDIVFPRSQAQSVLAVKERRGEKTLCTVWDVSVWAMWPDVGVSSLLLHFWRAPQSLQAKTLSISSHYSVTWNHKAKKLNQLLCLPNESNSLPERTRHAHISIATWNWLTLI